MDEVRVMLTHNIATIVKNLVLYAVNSMKSFLLFFSVEHKTMDYSDDDDVHEPDDDFMEDDGEDDFVQYKGPYCETP